MVKLPPLLPLALILVISSCSFDYGEARVAETLEEEIPTIAFSKLTHTRVERGKVSAVLEADEARLFDKKKEARLQKVHFREYDEEGGLLNEGWADEVVYQTESKDALVRGSIRVSSTVEKATLYTESLKWTQQARTLEASPPGEMVRILKENGSFLEGEGFQADFRRKVVSFRSGVRGRYESE